MRQAIHVSTFKAIDSLLSGPNDDQRRQVRVSPGEGLVGSLAQVIRRPSEFWSRVVKLLDFQKLPGAELRDIVLRTDQLETDGGESSKRGHVTEHVFR